MARLFKTNRAFYRFFWIFWIILVLLSLFSSCRAHKTTASSFSEETTSTCGTVWTQQLIDSLVRNMQISFTGLDIWIEPSEGFPIPERLIPANDGDSGTHKGAPVKVHLRADSAAVSLQEVTVSGSQSQMAAADSTHYAADGSSETENRPQGQTGHMIVIFLLIGIMALLISRL